MKISRPIVPILFALTLLVAGLLFTSSEGVSSQSRDRRVNTNQAQPENQNRPAMPSASPEVVKVDVDLITLDALVLEKRTARIVGGLTKDDFVVYEDGAKQTVTHFSQDSLPLSVL